MGSSADRETGKRLTHSRADIRNWECLRIYLCMSSAHAQPEWSASLSINCRLHAVHNAWNSSSSPSPNSHSHWSSVLRLLQCSPLVSMFSAGFSVLLLILLLSPISLSGGPVLYESFIGDELTITKVAGSKYRRTLSLHALHRPETHARLHGVVPMCGFVSSLTVLFTGRMFQDVDVVCFQS